MTVAALILAAPPESALADAAGRPAVRRIAEVAWAGGAVPLIVIAFDADGRVGSALAGSEAKLVEPAATGSGPAGHIVQGMGAARESIGETDAVLIWPARMTWVDAETVTSLLQAHGLEPSAVVRPTWQGHAGWPALVPLEHAGTLSRASRDLLPDALLDDLVVAGVASRLLESGDPGTTLDISVALDSLPDYEGPSGPLGGPPPEWGEAVGAGDDDASPLEGPSLAPYDRA